MRERGARRPHRAGRPGKRATEAVRARLELDALEEHQRAFLEERQANGEEVEELAALRVDGFAELLVGAFWSLRAGTPSDAPIAPSELRVVLQELGLGDLFLELEPLFRVMDAAFQRHVANRRKAAAEAARAPAAPAEETKGG